MLNLKDEKQVLVKQSDAIRQYLDALLQQIPETAEELDDTAAEVINFELRVDPTEVEAEANRMLSLVLPVAEPPQSNPPSVENNPDVQTQELVEQTAPLIPAYAREKFRVITMNTAGLLLAVPLMELGGVVKLTDELKPVANRPAWVKGLVRHKGQYVQVIDTYQIVIPEARRKQFPRPDTEPRYLVFDVDNRWALACDSISKMFTLEPHDVHWRGDHSRRPWLAGTVTERLCALIDLKKIGEVLEKGHILV